MSYKLVDKIKRIPWMVGKEKCVLEAWASFARNDGTNVIASKETAAARSGLSRWTIYRHTPELVKEGFMRPAASHECKVVGCSKGSTHYTGKPGHYTTVYRIDIWDEAMLQNTKTSHIAKRQKVSVANRRNPHVANRNTKGVKEENAALGRTETSVAERHGEVSEQASQKSVLNPVEAEEPQLGHEDGLHDYTLLESLDFLELPHGGKIDSESLHVGTGYYMECFHLLPEDMLKPSHNEESILAFIDCALDLQRRLHWTPYKWEAHWEEQRNCPVKRHKRVWDDDARHPIRQLVEWNQSHKSGGLVWTCGHDLAKAYWSDSSHSAVSQWQADDPSTCTKCRMAGRRAKAEGAD